MTNNGDRLYLEHILSCIRQIAAYIAGMDKQSFDENALVQDGCIRQLEIIGEATKRVSDELRTNNPHLPWKQMAGMRDVLIHDYLYVDLDIVWKTASESIPALEPAIELLLKNTK
ncbi:MAG: DUF86 domain-containing protein [Lewinellaceae bacterium]|nr:DUF86 domain-containing protein [Saprospiraceae bacterium]MCB9337969.1 DUF86 domain-containing protein [Lewinellaceae bacterium]